MLVDTAKIKAEKHVPDWSPGDYANDKSIYVFRMTWDGEDEGDLESYADVLSFVLSFEDDSEEGMTVAEACELLNSGRTFRIGPDEDWYRITPLEEPLTKGRWGEICPLSELDERNQDFEPPFDCRAGIDFPATLGR